jgi:hypothetical protein
MEATVAQEVRHRNAGHRQPGTKANADSFTFAAPRGLLTPMKLRDGVLGGLVLLTTGCGALLPPSVASDATHVRAAPKDANRCVVAATHSEPVVTEWTASSKARLEVLLNATLQNKDRTAVAVEYSGCELRIVDSCQPTGTYDWNRSTLSNDTMEIHDADDLFAKLPLGAVSLEGALKRAGRLSIQTTVVGQIKLGRKSINMEEVAADVGCSRATHIVQSVSIGAFKMMEGGSAKAGGSIGVKGIGEAGSSTERKEAMMRQSGSEEDCKQTTDGKPHSGCRSPLQLFLLPIPNHVQEVTLKQPTSPSPPTATEVAPQKKSGTLRLLSYIVGGLGVAGLGGGGISFASGGGTESRIRNGPAYETAADLSAAHSSWQTSQTMGAVGLITGGVLLGAAVPLFLLGGK